MRTPALASLVLAASFVTSPVLAQGVHDADQAKPAPATQKPPAKPKVPEPPPPMGFRGYFIVENTAMSASSTFDAVFGSSNMLGYGGGGEVLNLWKKVFVRVGVTSASKSGTRANRFSDGTVLPNDVPVEVSITNVDLSAGWRQALRKHPRFAFYGGGGLIIANYRERSEFADPGDDSALGYNGFSVFGGLEAGVWKYVIAGVEGQYRSVGNALGEDGLSKEYGEDNLGGFAIRGLVGVKFMKKKR